MGSANGTTSKKITAAERAERIKAAQEREARAKAKKEAGERTKKIVTVVVCAILIIALGLPTMSLTMCSAAGVA